MRIRPPGGSTKTPAPLDASPATSAPARGAPAPDRVEVRKRLELPTRADELPRWFQGRERLADVTLSVDQLPELARLVAGASARNPYIAPAVVMDLDGTLREGSLTPDLLRSMFLGSSASVKAAEQGVLRGRGEAPAAAQGSSESWLKRGWSKLLASLVVASSPIPFTGRTEAQVELMTRGLLEQGQFGKVFEGIRPFIRSAEAAGLQTFIVSAGFEAPARVVGEHLGIPRERVRGTRAFTVADHILPVPKLPLPFAGGKSDATTGLLRDAGLPPDASPALVLGDNPSLTDSGLVKRGWVDAVIEPDARNQAYIEQALARGEMVFAVDVYRQADGTPIQRFG